MKRRTGLINVNDAASIIKNSFSFYSIEKVELKYAQAQMLAEDLFSDRSYPPYDRVMMDGIAVSFKSIAENRKEFYVEDICPAGSSQKTLSHPHHCMEVMTGAVLPKNCDLVIPYEHLKIIDSIALLNNDFNYHRFDNIHAFGSDIEAGDLMLRRGSVLNAPEIGVAASIGASELSIFKPKRVALISTGDELVSITDSPAPHQIRRSNTYALQAMLQAFGLNDIEIFHLNDDKNSLDAFYKENASKFDVLIYSGGVSKGKYDFLPEVWKENKVECLLHGVTQRPGKPLWYGEDQANKCSVIGLPGNPISGLVCLRRYFIASAPQRCVLGVDFNFDKNLTYFLSVELSQNDKTQLIAMPKKSRNSGDFNSLIGSRGFIELASEQNDFCKGEVFNFYGWTP